MNDIIEALRGFGEACRAIPTAISSMCSAIATAAATCGRFMKETARAYYAIWGSYTFPLEQHPPRPSDLNALGRMALVFPIPLIPLSWLSSWTWIPLIGNSLQSISKAFVDVANIALFDLPESQWKTKVDDRNLLRKVVYGGPGYVLGCAFGAVTGVVIFAGRIITNSFKTTLAMFKSMVNWVMPAGSGYANTLTTDSRPGYLKYGFGMVGLGVGFLLGGVAAATVFLGRVISNTVKTSVSMFKSILNRVLPVDDEFKGGLLTDADRPLHLKFGMGILGLGVGAIIGGVSAAAVFLGRIISNTIKTSVSMFKSVVNHVLPAGSEFKEGLLTHTDRPARFKFGLGLPGVVIGALTGTMASAAIFLARCVINSAKTLVNTFKSTVNRVLPERFKFKTGLFSDERSNRLKYGMGMAGFVLGAGLGVVAGALVVLARAAIVIAVGAFALACGFLTHTKQSFVNTFKSTVNRVLPAESKFQQGLFSDDRLPRYKYGAGVLGCALGFALGVSAAAIVFLGRVIANSAKTTVSVVKSMLNRVLPAEYAFKDGLLSDNDRPRSLKFGMGVAGLGIGFVMGGVASAAIFLGRVITNSVKTTISMFKSLVNHVLPEGYAFKEGLLTSKDRPAHLKFGMGILGLGFGFVMGGVAAAAVFLGRVITNSVKTSISMFKSVVNHVLPEDYAFKEGLLTSKDRPAHLKFGMGALGLGFGFMMGGVAAAAVFLGRVITNSVKTTISMFKSLVNHALPTDAGFKTGLLSDNDRPARLKFSMGVAGLGVGFVIGGVAAAAIFLGRVITNSIKSIPCMFKSVVNLVLPEKYKYKDGLLLDKDRPAHLKYGMGLLGLGIGLVAGTVAAIDIFLGRVTINTVKTTISMFKSLVNHVLPVGYEFKDGLLSHKDRPAHLKYGIGVLGLGFGLVIGGISAAAIFLGRVITNSAKTTVSMFKSLVNHVLPENFGFKEGLLSSKDRPAHLKFGMGALGLGFGFVIGGVAAAAIFLGRVITNSVKTTISMFKSLVNHVLPESFAFKEGLLTSKDRPAHLKFGMGVAGLGFGFVMGGVAAAAIFLGRVITNSVKTTISMFKSLVNQVLPESYGFKEGLLTSKDRPAHLKFGMGALGLGFGFVIGGVAAAAIFLGRVITNSVKTTISMFKSLVNHVLPEGFAFKEGLLTSKDRPAHLKFGMGVAGLGFGFVMGGVAAAAIFLGRVITNSVKTTISMFKSLVNHVLPESYGFKEGLLTSKDRPAHLKFGMGALGLGFGFVIGGVAAAAIFLGRVITNSVKTTISMFKSLLNYVLPEGYGFKEGLLTSKDRPAHLKFGMGALGLGFGFVIGGVAAAAIFLGRAITNSVKTTISMFKSVVNHVLPEGYGFKTGLLSDKDRPARLKFGMGAVGLGMGLVLGCVATAGVFLARIVTNTIKTTASMFKSVVNRFLPDAYGFKTGLLTEKDRPAKLKYGMGMAGLGFGLIIGSVSAAAIFLGRVITNTVKTTASMFKSVVNRMLPENYQFKTGLVGDKDRPAHLKYGMGVLGLGFGMVMGGVAAAGVFIARVVTNSIQSTIGMFKTTLNRVLPEGYKFKNELGTDQRSAKLKYGFGILGLGVGLIAGGLAAAVVGVVRVLNESRHSWLALSGSFVNGAAGYRAFGGLGADDRSAGQKKAGILGYATAIVTTLPVAAMGYLITKVAPLVLGIFCGVVTSPFIAAKKWLNMCCRPRFSQPSNRGSIEQGFKNLYSSLTAMGKFKAGAAVANNGSGGKGIGAFIRKTLTFNVNITTERVLDELLKTYRRFTEIAKQSINRQSDFFSSSDFENAVDKVKQYYLNDCTRTQANKEAISKEIDDVTQFVKDYMVQYLNRSMQDSKPITVPAKLYSQKETSWTANFWGGRRENKSDNNMSRKLITEDKPSGVVMKMEKPVTSEMLQTSEDSNDTVVFHMA